ncbi:MAG TPA: hypothetical protein VLI45_04195 [Acidobacteriaceae bacterium]|nr:hypothetical protein [Acidobacteriaceae bacterium]
MARVRFNSAGVEPTEMKAARVGLWCSVAALIAWLAMTADSAMRPVQGNRREIIWLLSFCFTLAAIGCVHRVQRGRSRTELIGFCVFAAASAIALAGNLSMQLHFKPLAVLGSPAGAMAWLAGLACFGVGTLSARALPWYAGLALIVLEPASVVAALVLPHIAPLAHRVAYTGHLGIAFAMLAVALGMRKYAKAVEVQGVCYSRLVSAVQTQSLSREA